jgi:hypothetical protein
MAACAICAKLAAMKIGVAVSARCAYVSEDKAGMTLTAANVHVHASQWIPGLVVLKLGHATDRLPSGKRMAILAWA